MFILNHLQYHWVEFAQAFQDDNFKPPIIFKGFRRFRDVILIICCHKIVCSLNENMCIYMKKFQMTFFLGRKQLYFDYQFRYCHIFFLAVRYPFISYFQTIPFLTHMVYLTLQFYECNFMDVYVTSMHFGSTAPLGSHLSESDCSDDSTAQLVEEDTCVISSVFSHTSSSL